MTDGATCGHSRTVMRVDDHYLHVDVEHLSRCARPPSDNHRMVRNGSLWTCLFCPVSLPFPSVYPRDETLGPCVPRAWREETT